MALLESDLQKAIIRWSATLEPRYPEFKWLYHVPNGGRRDSREAQDLKSQGVRPGIWDLALDVARGGFHGWRCELKKPGASPALRPEQAEYGIFLEQQGYCCLVSSDFDEVKEHLLRYIGGGLIRDNG